MANRRMINRFDTERPEWAELSSKQKFLYWAAILLTDDDGIAPTLLIEREFFGEVIEDSDWNALQDRQFTYCYEVNERTYVQIMFWWEKQFIDSKIYKVSKYPKCSYYLPRPKNLKKRRKDGMWTFYSDEGEALEQVKVNESNSKEDKEEKRSLSEKKLMELSGSVPVPFEADGSTNSRYQIVNEADHGTY